ncbi:phosphate acyltransferase, partial [Acinetobacter baumannii]
MGTRGRISADARGRYDRALGLFQAHVDVAELTEQLGLAEAHVVTPLRFQYGLMERARSDRRHIVLPEGDDDRILRAAAALLSREVA